MSDLYNPIILQHQRQPYHYARLPGATVVLDAHNPLCGDAYQIYLVLEAHTITAAYFFGYGCAVSMASASMLVQRLEGLSLTQAPGLLALLAQIADPAAEPPANEPQLAAFLPVRAHPARLACVTLPWDAVAGWLAERDSPLANHKVT